MTVSTEAFPRFLVCDSAIAHIASLIQQFDVVAPDVRVIKVLEKDHCDHDMSPLTDDEAISGTADELFARALALLAK